MIKAVIDTNLIVSAIISPKGTPANILRAWGEGLFELVISQDIIAELRRVLSYPKIIKSLNLSEQELENLMVEFAKTKGFVEPKKKLTVVKADPDDNKLVEAAVEGKAGFIVSGDQHLKDLHSYKSIRVVAASTFLKIIKS